MRKIQEAEITTGDINAVFKSASDGRDKTGVFGMLKKKKVELADLQQAWKNHSPIPYPDDTEDITAILKDHGFSDREIKRAYSDALGRDDSGKAKNPVASKEIQKIADYIVKNGLKDDILSILERDYKFKESVLYDGKMMIEDVRKVFTRIIEEERSDRFVKLKEFETKRLGRARK